MLVPARLLCLCRRDYFWSFLGWLSPNSPEKSNPPLKIGPICARIPRNSDEFVHSKNPNSVCDSIRIFLDCQSHIANLLTKGNPRITPLGGPSARPHSPTVSGFAGGRG